MARPAVTVSVRHPEGWIASVTDGRWTCRAPGVAAFLQSICDVAGGYRPDEDMTCAALVREWMPELELVDAPRTPRLAPSRDY